MGFDIKDRCTLVTIGSVAGGALVLFWLYKQTKQQSKVKLNEKKEREKYTVTDVEDIGAKKAYCRCWKSNKFPLCDGSHSKHNKETGDNIGPLVVKDKTQAS